MTQTCAGLGCDAEVQAYGRWLTGVGDISAAAELRRLQPWPGREERRPGTRVKRTVRPPEVSPLMSNASTASTAAFGPDLLDLRYVSGLGYGHPQTIRDRIHRGEVPAVLVGNRFKIRREDLHLLAKPLGPANTNDEDDLDALVKQIVDGFPPLTADEKAELGQLLAAALR